MAESFIEPPVEERLEDKRLYCICKGNDDGTFMICCDICSDWFHGRCVGIRERDGKQIDKYVCPVCTETGKGSTTYKGIKRSGGEVEEPEAKRQRLLNEEEKRKKDIERRKRIDEEQARRREEIQRQRKLEEAERLLEIAESKKRLEQEEKSKRAAIQQNLKQSLDAGFASDQKEEPLPDSVLPTLKSSQQTSIDIEEALYKQYNGYSKEYLAKYRMLAFNLRDKKNKSLRLRIFSGELSETELVRMDSQQLASKELQEYRKMRDKAAFASVYKGEEDTKPRYKFTHKGIEHIDDNEPAGDDLEILRKNDVIIADPENPLSSSGATPQSGLNNSGGSGSGGGGSQNTSTTTTSTSTTTSDKLNASGAKDSPTGALNESEVNETNEEKEVDLDIDLGDVNIEPMIEADIIAPPILVPTSDVKTIDFKDSGWSGRVDYSFKGLSFSLGLDMYHINGIDMEDLLPPVLRVENRIVLNDLIKYLSKLENSSSRAVTSVYFEVSSKDSEKDKSTYKKFFQHLKKMKRGGVFTISPSDLQPGIDRGYFKEMYIFPLSAHESLPQFIKGDEYDHESDDMLVGVFLTAKGQKPSRSLLHTSESSSNMSNINSGLKTTLSHHQHHDNDNNDLTDLYNNSYVPTEPVGPSSSSSSSSDADMIKTDSSTTPIHVVDSNPPFGKLDGGIIGSSASQPFNGLFGMNSTALNILSMATSNPSVSATTPSVSSSTSSISTLTADKTTPSIPTASIALPVSSNPLVSPMAPSISTPLSSLAPPPISLPAHLVSTLASTLSNLAKRNVVPGTTDSNNSSTTTTTTKTSLPSNNNEDNQNTNSLSNEDTVNSFINDDSNQYTVPSVTLGTPLVGTPLGGVPMGAMGAVGMGVPNPTGLGSLPVLGANPTGFPPSIDPNHLLGVAGMFPNPMFPQGQVGLIPSVPVPGAAPVIGRGGGSRRGGVFPRRGGAGGNGRGSTN
eukprot:TRINITY_DN1016_c1_g1_i3.p2 TRINITY_DN1016_c1_g1~~TRINITY_DN1016_c1_g1_i3.p2  ORF type:complete len:961 (-),score=260.57 TRINITY_DN1016_c1_g1_i3:283-3165(-)